LNHHNKNAAVGDVAAVYKNLIFVCCHQDLDVVSFGDSPNVKMKSWSALKMQFIAALTYLLNT